MRAGIKNLAAFGPYATIDALAGGDLLKHEQVLQLPYADVFAKLLYDKHLADYRRKLHKLLTEKMHNKKA